MPGRRARALRRAREVIARLVDGSTFWNSRPAFAADRVRPCPHRRPAVGILGNNGPIQPEGSTQGGAVHPAVRPGGTPLVFLQNTTGYMVAGGRALAPSKHGSKMIQAVANATRAQVHHRARAALRRRQLRHAGAASTRASSSPGPAARTAVMGGAPTAMVMDIVNRGKLERMRAGRAAEALASRP